MHKGLHTMIEYSNFKQRTKNILRCNGFHTIKHLLDMKVCELLRLQQFDDDALTDMIKCLKAYEEQDKN